MQQRTERAGELIRVGDELPGQRQQHAQAAAHPKLVADGAQALFGERLPAIGGAEGRLLGG